MASQEFSPHLQGTLLLAAPRLTDPNFVRSVLYLASHSKKEGAFGYILNRPMGKVVGELLQGQALGRLREVPVYLGGPVSTDKLSFAALVWSEKRELLQCKTHLSMEDAEHELLLGNQVRGFIGYSGWTVGQLEREVQQHSWIVAPAGRSALEMELPEGLWTDILTDLGPRFELVARMPEHPEWN